MAKREGRKPRLSLQVEPEDRQALDAVNALVRLALPALGDQSLSVTMRAAIRLGLTELVKHPERAMTATTPDVQGALEELERQANGRHPLVTDVHGVQHLDRSRRVRPGDPDYPGQDEQPAEQPTERKKKGGAK